MEPVNYQDEPATQEELIQALVLMVRQHCAGYDGHRDRYDSGFISSDAFAIRCLLSLGVLEPVDKCDSGRWIVAKENERSKQIV